jgi:tRNA threonylcarbamoyladenosine biosynthesis protein TsaE
VSQTITIQNSEDTERIGERLAVFLRPGDLLCLTGDLGAGKTTLARGIVRGLKSPALVSSPTFTLIHEYTGGRFPVYHADAYRLLGAEDAIGTGLEDYILRGDGVLLLEWWERIAELLPDERLEIRFLETDNDTRKITLIPHGERWQGFTLTEEETSC